MTRWSRWIALAGMGGWALVGLILWSGGAPLGHDEAQYALAARDALAGEPPRWFYLSRGMTAIAAPGVWLGGSDQALRAMSLVLGVGFIAAAYLLGRRALGAMGAALAMCVLASARTLVRLGSDLLSDVPAAACLLGALALIVDEVDREDGPRWRLVAVAPLLAAALYIRYGSAVYIAVIVVAGLIVGARTLGRNLLPVATAAAVFLLLLIPHFVEAHALTGSPLGILLASREVPQQEHVADGLLTYVTSNPFRYYGLVTPPVLVAGLLTLQVRDRRRLLVWIVAVASFVAMGLVTHGMVRYVLFPVTLLVLLGAERIVELVQRVPLRPRRVLVAIAAAGMLYVWTGIAVRAFHADEYRARRMRGTLAATPVIRADAAGRPCVVLGYNSTQLEWYSGCTLAERDGNAVRHAHATGKRAYVVRDHTPTWSASWTPVFAEMPGTPHVLLATRDVEVARIDPRIAPR